MRILGIDYGKKRIGLSLLITEHELIVPYGCIEYTDPSVAFQKINTIISKDNIKKIIIGLPLDLSGKEGRASGAVRDFGTVLFQNTGIEPVYIDERYTSLGADALGGVAGRDEKSAMLLLEVFLSQEKLKHSKE